MSKSLGDAIKEEKRKHKTTRQKFPDFLIGTKVQVISPCVDFCFFRGTETGYVIRNNKSSEGIIVKFDEPMVYEDGFVRTEHGFDPDDLKILKRMAFDACPHCHKPL